MKKLCIAVVAATLLIFLGCAKTQGNSVPFLPIDGAKVTKIQINSGFTRYATDNEQKQIIGLLNSSTAFTLKVSFPKYSNGKPDILNIQVFTRDITDGRNFMYILPYKGGRVLISRPQSGVGYIMDEPLIAKYLQ